jgi:hypothetical protein
MFNAIWADVRARGVPQGGGILTFSIFGKMID